MTPETPRTKRAWLPPHTRLILASENLLEQWGARTEDGYLISAEWGEQQPQGWYEPQFTVHYDKPFPVVKIDAEAAALDVERLARAIHNSGAASPGCKVLPFDPYHREHDGKRATALIAAYGGQAVSSPINTETLVRALLLTREHVNYPKRWRQEDFEWLARQVIAAYAESQGEGEK